MPKLHLNLDTLSYDKIMDMAPCLNEAVKCALDDSLNQVYDKWVESAKSSLKSGKASYISGLSIQKASDYAGSVVLQGDFPTRLEKGSPPYDLKVLFSRSSKLKFAKSGGWYLDVPMRQGTPNAVNFSSNMPYSVYTPAKKLPTWGVMRTDVGKTESWNGYQYTTSSFDYLTKVPIKQGSRSLNTYMVWRRVSENSDPSSWMHPGFKGAHLTDQIVPYANSIFETNVRNYIQKVFGF